MDALEEELENTQVAHRRAMELQMAAKQDRDRLVKAVNHLEKLVYVGREPVCADVCVLCGARS